MPRVLTCIDPVPAEDGTCAQAAYIEQRSIVDLLPSVEQADEVGFAFFGTVVLVAAMSLFFPSKAEE